MGIGIERGYTLLQVFDMPTSVAFYLEAAYKHLRAHGIHAKPPVVQAYGMKQGWLKDPDGYSVCLQWLWTE